MYLLYTFISTTILTWIVSSTHAFPLTDSGFKLQTVFYEKKTSLYNSDSQVEKDKWFSSQEFDVYTNVVQHYQNMVDSTVSSESENLLLDLIHLPSDYRSQILNAQAKLLGMESLTDRQIIKMPSIIGKHVQTMNAQVYKSIEPTIALYWRSIWNIKLLKREENAQQQEEELLSFLSSFNGLVAKRLIDEIDEYDLLSKVRDELEAVPNTIAAVVDAKLTSHFLYWAKNQISVYLPSITIVSARTTVNSRFTMTDLETDFLRQHVSNVRTGILMELHIQFMEFFTRIQTDIIEQLSFYYDN